MENLRVFGNVVVKVQSEEPKFSAKQVGGVNIVATYAIDEDSGQPIIQFEMGRKGVARYALETHGWLVTRGDRSDFFDKDELYRAFVHEFDTLIPDEEPEIEEVETVRRSALRLVVNNDESELVRLARALDTVIARLKGLNGHDSVKHILYGGHVQTLYSIAAAKRRAAQRITHRAMRKDAYYNALLDIELLSRTGGVKPVTPEVLTAAERWIQSND